MNQHEMELANFFAQYMRDHPEADGPEVLQKYYESKQGNAHLPETQLRGGVEVQKSNENYT
ncbi:724_t:CDS:2, partial [Ambispora gerdemannii]